MLTTHTITYQYKGRNSMVFPDVTVSNDQHLLILGKSGIGKTTLLHILAGLLSPVTGQVLVDNQDIYKLSSSALDKFRGQHIGLIFQQPYFLQSISVAQNLAWAQHLANKKEDRLRITNLLKRLKIDHHADHLPSRLSVGEQQRATIARAIVNKPSIILADEPTSALDDENAEAVVQLLKEQAHEDGAALIIVTHDARIKNHFSQQITLGA